MADLAWLANFGKVCARAALQRGRARFALVCVHSARDCAKLRESPAPWVLNAAAAVAAFAGAVATVEALPCSEIRAVLARICSSSEGGGDGGGRGK